MAPVSTSDSQRELLKPFRQPLPWIGLWALAIIAVVLGSLSAPVRIPLGVDYADKIQHFAAYGFLAAFAVQLFHNRAALCLAGLALAMLGVGLEFAQGAFTAERMQDGWDALANTLGVIAGLALRLTPLRDGLLKLDARLFASE